MGPLEQLSSVIGRRPERTFIMSNVSCKFVTPNCSNEIEVTACKDPSRACKCGCDLIITVSQCNPRNGEITEWKCACCDTVVDVW
jgi:hypothetical protein